MEKSKNIEEAAVGYYSKINKIQYGRAIKSNHTN